jgi:uncharacterized protein DUF2019
MVLKDLGAALQDYKRSAHDHKEASTHGEPDRGNRAYKEMIQALEAIQTHGDAGRQALVSLLKDEDLGVRISAAAHLLKTDPDKAKPVLEEAARKPGLLAFNAKMTLREYERGHLSR